MLSAEGVLIEVRIDGSGVKFAVRDLPAVPGRSEPEFDGVLGIGLFKDYLLVLDYPARRVRIEKGELPPTDGREVLDFEERRGIPIVKLPAHNKP
jgi:hypothetical protein